MTAPGDWPWEPAAAELSLRCQSLAGVIELDPAGTPVGFRRRCRDRWCCPPKPGHAAYHRWRLVGDGAGTYETAYVPLRPVGEILGRETMTVKED